MEIKNKQKTVSKNINDQRDKDREMVRGMFHFYEVPGGILSFPYKAYKGDPVKNYTFKDGEVATIPLGVAKHLNKNGWYPQYEYFKNEDTQDIMRISKKVHRFGFESLEFTDIEDLKKPSDIVVVEKEIKSPGDIVLG